MFGVHSLAGKCDSMRSSSGDVAAGRYTTALSSERESEQTKIQSPEAEPWKTRQVVYTKGRRCRRRVKLVKKGKANEGRLETQTWRLHRDWETKREEAAIEKDEGDGDED